MANTTNTNASHNFDVGIIGGGIAGLTLAIGLLNQKIPVTIYEAAHNFGEIGAGVFFQPNAVRAMNGIDPRITAGFEKVATFNKFDELKDVYFDYRLGEGPNAGELIARPKCLGPHAGVHRARFLDELIKIVPKEASQFGKRLTHLKMKDGEIQLNFKDGTVASHDCIIGADGVHSVVRKFVLGPDDPAVNAVFSGGYCHRGLIPMDKAIGFLGEEMALNCQSHLGHGGHLLTFPVDNYRTFNAVAFSSCDTWDHEKWVVPGHEKDIHEDFKSFGKPGQDIISQMENTDIWALFHHLPAKTFYKGKVIIIGDAAHATTPYQGNGAGFATEDAYVLSSLLGHVQSPNRIESCFRAFDAVRRERGLKLVQTSAEAGKLWCMEDKVAGDDPKKIRENALERFQWIWGVDHEADIKEGLRLMNS